MKYKKFDCEECTRYNLLIGEIDDMINTIGREIDKISIDNDDFVCSRCIDTARALYRLMHRYAREEDAQSILERFERRTGINLAE